jgi:Tfp pilus assembly protein PilO
MTLISRVVAEKRRLILPLAVAAAVNVVAYAAFVYPLSGRVQAAERRAELAALGVVQASQRSELTRSTARGKAQAGRELERFYREVLPPDLAAARRITYLRLAQLAARTNLKYERRTVTFEPVEDSPLSRLDMSMILAGSYPDIRRFVHELETAPEFVVIEHISLVQDADASAAIELTIDVSTYFLTPRHGG